MKRRIVFFVFGLLFIGCDKFKIKSNDYKLLASNDTVYRINQKSGEVTYVIGNRFYLVREPIIETKMVGDIKVAQIKELGNSLTLEQTKKLISMGMQKEEVYHLYKVAEKELLKSEPNLSEAEQWELKYLELKSKTLNTSNK